MVHRVGLSGRTTACEVLLAPAVDVDAPGVRRRRVEVCACRECKTARDKQAGSRPGSVVLHDVCLLETTGLATHRLPVSRPEMSCCAPLSAARRTEHVSEH